MNTKEQVFSLAELSGIAAKHMGVNLMSWEMIGGSQMRVKGIVPEPKAAPPAYVQRFEQRVTVYMRRNPALRPAAVAAVLGEDWREAIEEQRVRYYAVRQQEFYEDVNRTWRAYGGPYDRAFDRAIDDCHADALKLDAAHNASRTKVIPPVHARYTNGPSATFELNADGFVPNDFRNAKPARPAMPFNPKAIEFVLKPRTVHAIDTSADRHRKKRADHAERVCGKHGAFDWETVPMAEGERLDVRARLERLEAAVMEMASHDPTGPITSARDFLSLRVSKPLSKVLRTVVYK
jgi:hypothetical protein